MGFQRSCCRILFVFLLLLVYSSFGESMNSTRYSLDRLLQEYAYRSLIRRRTGTVYNVTLPSNLTGMEASVVRLRTRSLWITGTNFSNFFLPPKILPDPFAKRVTIVYQNLGNWSSTYYNVSGYTMVTPVIGFLLYNDSNTTATTTVKLNITVMRAPISIRFPQVKLPSQASNSTLKCVRFNENGTVEFTDMGLNNVCLTRTPGHFTVVVPEVPKKRTTRERNWKWLVVGFALGFAGLVAMGLVGFMVYKCVKKKKFGEMEKRAVEGESFENVWIGTSRMPSATLTRTQPALEHNEVP